MNVTYLFLQFKLNKIKLQYRPHFVLYGTGNVHIHNYGKKLVEFMLQTYKFYMHPALNFLFDFLLDFELLAVSNC